jgi:hypothetical protein
VGLLFLAACAPAAAEEPAGQPLVEGDAGQILVYASPTWGCCGDWITYLRDNGFTVQTENVQNLHPVKQRYQVPLPLQSCHTAIVDGYVIEGHVPADAIERLLSERPAIVGIAVPSMPIGSPGMEVAGVEPEPFDVFAFDGKGNGEIFASYGQ